MESVNKGIYEIKTLYDNLKKANLQLTDFNPSSDILEGTINYFYQLIELYINHSIRNKQLFKKINYLCNKIKSRKDSDNLFLPYNLTKKESTRKALFLFYLSIFYYQISLQGKKNMKKLKIYIIYFILFHL